MQAGQYAIVDAVFLQPKHRRWVEQIALRTGRQFLGIWLHADAEKLVERVTLRTGDASDADATIVRQQLAVRAESACWTKVNADGALERTMATAERVMAQHFNGRA